MWLVKFSQQMPIISLKNIMWQVFVEETELVFCEVGDKFLYVI